MKCYIVVTTSEATSWLNCASCEGFSTEYTNTLSLLH